jgi:putative transcriptional regulator
VEAGVVVGVKPPVLAHDVRGCRPTTQIPAQNELNEGFDALEAQRAGKRTLRTHMVKVKPAPKITARELAKIRKDMNLSRGLFAGYLRTNVRTLENWEQGRATPNAQAALLIRLVQRFPDTVRRLAEI